jgi:hypothetical protein
MSVSRSTSGSFRSSEEMLTAIGGAIVGITSMAVLIYSVLQIARETPLNDYQRKAATGRGIR